MDRKTVFDYVNKKYKSTPEYLWARDPESAVLRQGDNNKWYAVIMNVPKEKLGLIGTEKIEILNIKCDPEIIGSMRMIKGIFAGYHMNKENWISVLLDGSVDENMIFDLVDMSYDLTKVKRKTGNNGNLRLARDKKGTK